MNTAVFKNKNTGKSSKNINHSNGGLSVVIPVFNSEGIILE
ncbi:uncharacterized protein METZ01_LOCUS495678, partial [marine metagenome]